MTCFSLTLPKLILLFGARQKKAKKAARARLGGVPQGGSGQGHDEGAYRYIRCNNLVLITALACATACSRLAPPYTTLQRAAHTAANTAPLTSVHAMWNHRKSACGSGGRARWGSTASSLAQSTCTRPSSRPSSVVAAAGKPTSFIQSPTLLHVASALAQVWKRWMSVSGAPLLHRRHAALPPARSRSQSSESSAARRCIRIHNRELASPLPCARWSTAHSPSHSRALGAGWLSSGRLRVSAVAQRHAHLRNAAVYAQLARPL